MTSFPSWCSSLPSLHRTHPISPSSPSIRTIINPSRTIIIVSAHKDRQISLSANPQTSPIDKLSTFLHYGAALAAVNAPAALAVTGENNEEVDLVATLIGWGIVAVLYFLVAPPIIFNWMRLRWYKRKFLELYFQFMFVFLFFPGMLLWAPFLNFRKFPRDPTMKNPWDTPKDDVPLYKLR